ncbi:MAG: TetR/AcrR family transcriptional regulator [Panacagrimonas sp.]|jgi:AcrR family transcriptional regulator|nr:TetR/AcrR family transcriptional regulator [Panacagrimonas sp.]MCC2657577.1 TetR/AcrR family transcriptional regulator [Panacagrimonas sp.]
MNYSSAAIKVKKNLQRRKEIGQERRERTRTRLLAAAAQVLAEHGEKKATIDDFIQAAGVARGTFYNYYQTRGEILDDLWAEIGRNPFVEIQKACASIKDPAERLVTKTRLILKTAQDNSTWGWVVFALSLDITTVNADLLAFPRPDLEDGLRRGRFKFDDIHAAKDLVVGACRTALHALLIEERSEDYPRALSALMLRSLGIAATEAQTLVKRPLPTGRSGPSHGTNGTAVNGVSAP